MPIPAGKSPGLELLRTPATPSPGAGVARAEAIRATPGECWVRPPPRRVVDQGSVPCCVSCALTSAMEILHGEWPALAPLFHYHVAARGAGSAGDLEIEDGRDVLAYSGVCKQTLHPYPIREDHVRSEPSSAAFADALERRMRLVGYRLPMGEIITTSRAAEIRRRLQLGCPVVIGFRRPNRFPVGILDSRYEWKDPTAGAGSHVGHCVLITGFSDARLALHVQDSEGPDKYDRGGWWMTYRVVDSAVVERAFYLDR